MFSKLRVWLGALTVLAASAAAGQGLVGGTIGASSSVVQTEQVRAELLAHAPQGLGPGRPVWLGLQIEHQREWHTYWKNPGDSGLPTTLAWTLPQGLQAGEIAWPTPKKFPLGDLANYGYEGTLLLPVPLRIEQPVSGASLNIELQARWLVCRRECIPQEGRFTLRLPTQGSIALHTAAFEAALAAQPQPLEGTDRRIEVRDQALHLDIGGLPRGAQGRPLEIFFETPGLIETAGPWQQRWEAGRWQAQVPLSKMRSDSPSVVPIVLALQGSSTAWRLEPPVSGHWPPAAALAGVSPALEAALKDAQDRMADATVGWLAALAGALLGGLILNLMPCVFPVLALKVLGFAQMQQGQRLQLGLAYTVGVLLSFVALGAALMGLRAAGQELGWGFQLQSPAVVASLAVLFTLLGLNLAGLFEFGQLAPGSVAALQPRHPAANAALSGVLAVAIASPCTAPFMGASLGAALTLPTGQGLSIFAMLGLGMALPYLLISAVPALGRALPRPGAWMMRLKQFMAFPMLATVVWLLWVLGQQSGIDGAASMLLLLLLLALLLWTLGLTGRSRAVSATSALLLLLAALWWAGPQVLRAQLPAQSAAGAETEVWEAWRADRVKQLNAEGRPVLVDFTAAWCITCQYNKQTALKDPEFLREARKRHLALLRADWTQRDPAITAALRELGRSGVPVYAIYAPGRPPTLLSEILTVQELRQALAKL